MNSEIYVGHECNICGAVIGLTSVVGSHATCRGCGGKMQRSMSQNTRVLTNVRCEKCGAGYGLVSIAGSSQFNCKSCGYKIA